MARVVFLVIVLVIGVGMSGCFQGKQTSAQPCNTEPCTSQPKGTDSTGTGPTSGPTSPTTSPTPELASFDFQECSGLIIGVEIPTDLVVDDIPAAFDPAGPDPFLALLEVEGYECPRVVHGQKIYNDILMLWSFVAAEPKNQSWTQGGSSFYTWEVFVTDETLASELALAGTNAEFGSATRTLTPLANGQVREEFEGGNDTARFRMTASYNAGPGQVLPSSGEIDRYQWFGGGPFDRVHIHHRVNNTELGGTGAGRVELSGDSGFRRAVGADSSPFYTQAARDMHWVVDPMSLKFSL